MNKAVFLDRDGTINVEKNYLYRIEDFEFLPEVITGLKRLKEAGYLLIIVTNQSGIARGYYTEDQYKVLEEWMLQQLENEDITIDGVYYCPHLKDAPIEKYRINCNCRKPQLGMFERAVAEHDIDLQQSIAIGDKIRDLAICNVSGTQGYLVYCDDVIGDDSISENVHYVSGGINLVADIVLKGDKNND